MSLRAKGKFASIATIKNRKQQNNQVCGILALDIGPNKIS